MTMTPEELREFFQQFQDYLAPKLDTYEQAIYLYIFRHTRFVGLSEGVIALKSARSRMACGIGKAGTPMSEHQAFQKLASLQQKHCVTVVQTEHKGRRIRLHLPKEIQELVPAKPVSPPELGIEQMDFFNDAQNRLAILKRESFRCFYTLKEIDVNSFVIDHVVSRPHGNNSYRNVVAASREANNRKGASSAEDFVRQLFREGYLSEEEFDARLKALSDLKQGHLKPAL
ncbi:MAG: HNH endonuclease signature motif containing protein [Methyloceanibacter sp.]